MDNQQERSGGGARITFFVHAADRTGPPVVLLHQLRWLRSHTDWALTMVFLRGGELLERFAELGQVVVLEPGPDVGADVPAGRRRAQIAALPAPDLVYVNTAWSIHGLRWLPDRSARPVVAAVHELDCDLRDTMPPASLAELMAEPDHFVAGAEVIARNLVEGYRIAPERITVVPEAIELPSLDRPSTLSRTDLGLGADDFVVVAAGSPVWRKGPDLLVHTAWRLGPEIAGRPVRFLWLGADPDAGHPDLVGPLDDRRRLGLGEQVRFLPPTDRVFDHLRLADAFVLTSREDAFPLVCLEAASVGLPIVCFDNGGIPDLIEDGAGIVVPFPDLDALAAALVDLASDTGRAAALGAEANRRVRLHHGTEVGGAALRDVLAGWLP